MTLTQRTALLAVMGMTTLGLSTGSASAATAITTEPAGGTCSNVTFVNHGSGGATGCRIHATSAGQIEIGTPFGMIKCDNEFFGRIGVNGSGFLFSHTLTNCDHSVAPCTESGVVDNWPVTLTGERMMEIGFCLTAFGFLSVNCTQEAMALWEWDEDHGPGSVSTSGVPGQTFPGGRHASCDESASNTIQGTWWFENDTDHPEIEITD